jgi:hypothetical protein
MANIVTGDDSFSDRDDCIGEFVLDFQQAHNTQAGASSSLGVGGGGGGYNSNEGPRISSLSSTLFPLSDKLCQHLSSYMPPGKDKAEPRLVDDHISHENESKSIRDSVNEEVMEATEAQLVVEAQKRRISELEEVLSIYTHGSDDNFSSSISSRCSQEMHAVKEAARRIQKLQVEVHTQKEVIEVLDIECEEAVNELHESTNDIEQMRAQVTAQEEAMQSFKKQNRWLTEEHNLIAEELDQERQSHHVTEVVTDLKNQMRHKLKAAVVEKTDLEHDISCMLKEKNEMVDELYRVLRGKQELDDKMSIQLTCSDSVKADLRDMLVSQKERSRRARSTNQNPKIDMKMF